MQKKRRNSGCPLKATKIPISLERERGWVSARNRKMFRRNFCYCLQFSQQRGVDRHCTCIKHFAIIIIHGFNGFNPYSGTRLVVELS
jgi:hypothetical protein